ncbi:MAG TPA: response regulator transcription factor [Acidobacteriaceae bacterium]|jgi:DNA-binding response OmpR family regulator|nr:response regulator transcription factor [Acidobacteriaceae bacterium]
MPPTTARRILIVEDERKIADAIAAGLRDEQYEVEVAYSGEEALSRIAQISPDVMVLDIMLPGKDGLQVLRTTRQVAAKFPVLLLTSKDSVEDRVAGLDAGADDYLVKPFAFAELSARIRALSRRRTMEEPIILEYADLCLDDARNIAYRSGVRLDLTHREFQLLHYLLQHRERVVSREMLARDVWQETARYTPLDNVIDVQIARLRRKLDDPFARKLLHTVRGVGFILKDESA